MPGYVFQAGRERFIGSIDSPEMALYLAFTVWKEGKGEGMGRSLQIGRHSPRGMSCSPPMRIEEGSYSAFPAFPGRSPEGMAHSPLFSGTNVGGTPRGAFTQAIPPLCVPFPAGNAPRKEGNASCSLGACRSPAVRPIPRGEWDVKGREWPAPDVAGAGNQNFATPQPMRYLLSDFSPETTDDNVA